jgi:hypothetical protein
LKPGGIGILDPWSATRFLFLLIGNPVERNVIPRQIEPAHSLIAIDGAAFAENCGSKVSQPEPVEADFREANALAQKMQAKA